MFVKVRYTIHKSLHIRFLNLFLIYTAMHLKSSGCNHNNSKFRLYASFTTLYIIELLCTKVSTESSFCNDIITKCHSHLCSKYGVTSMSNVGKRTTMNKGCCMLSSLHKVWRQCIFQQYCYCTGNAKVFNSKFLIIKSES